MSIVYQCVLARLQYGLQYGWRSSIGGEEEMIRRPWAANSAPLERRRDRGLARRRTTRSRGIPEPQSRSPAGGSTFCGRCCATEPCLRPALRLDIFIEIPYHTRRFRSARAKHAHCPVMVVRAKTPPQSTRRQSTRCKARVLTGGLSKVRSDRSP